MRKLKALVGLSALVLIRLGLGPAKDMDDGDGGGVDQDTLCSGLEYVPFIAGQLVLKHWLLQNSRGLIICHVNCATFIEIFLRGIF